MTSSSVSTVHKQHFTDLLTESLAVDLCRCHCVQCYLTTCGTDSAQCSHVLEEQGHETVNSKTTANRSAFIHIFV